MHANFNSCFIQTVPENTQDYKRSDNLWNRITVCLNFRLLNTVNISDKSHIFVNISDKSLIFVLFIVAIHVKTRQYMQLLFSVFLKVSMIVSRYSIAKQINKSFKFEWCLYRCVFELLYNAREHMQYIELGV